MNRILQWRRLKRFLQEQRTPFDLVHALWLDDPGGLALKAGAFLKVPVVASLGGGEAVWLPEIRYGGSGSVQSRSRIRRVLQSAQRITAGSRYALSLIREARPDALWLPLFPETEPFIAKKERDPAPPFRMLQVASINRVKDPFTLLEALRIVKEGNDALLLEWVGEDTLKGAVQRRAKAMGLEDKVRFHGFKPYDALPRFFHRAHLYIQSSLHESQGVAVCEAAAAGLPIVGTEVGLVRELAPESALAVPAGDAPTLAQALLNLMEDGSRRKRLGDRARAWAEIHNADWTAKQLLACYAGLISQENGQETGS
jgi:glycosyltransferase involved in cell wall biosynthesis